MKIGLFITGHLRHAPQIKENYEQFFNHNDVSVYVGTWSTKDILRGSHKLDDTPVEAEKICNNLFGDSLKGLWVGDMDKFLKNESPAPNSPPRTLWNDYVDAYTDPARHLAPWPQRVLDQWYAVWQSFLLADKVDYESFDVVIRIRGDMTFLGKPTIPFYDVRDGIHVNGYVWWTNPTDRENGTLVDGTNLIPYALSDQLAWGTPQWMTKYMEYYRHFAHLWAGRINAWGGDVAPNGNPMDVKLGSPESFLFNSEHMMSYYLLKYPYYKQSLKGDEDDMIWHRHGHDNRFDHMPDGVYYVADYYNLFKPHSSLQ